MSINRTAEYVVLWKSHKRAEWAAVGLDHRAAALRQRQQQQTGQRRPHPGPAAAAAGPATATRNHRTVAADPADVEIAAELQFLEMEGQRMWRLHAEIGAELAQAEILLTHAQRKSAENVLKQWTRAEAGG